MEKLTAIIAHMSSTIHSIPAGFKVLAVIVLTWLLGRLVKRLITKALKAFNFSDSEIKLARVWLHTGIWFVGFLTILYVYGVNPWTLLKSFGGSTILIGFIFRSTLSNVGAGIRLRYFKNDFVLGNTFVAKGDQGPIFRFGLTHFYFKSEADDFIISVPYSSLSGFYKFNNPDIDTDIAMFSMKKPPGEAPTNGTPSTRKEGVGEI